MLEIGSVVTGRVTRIEPYGVYLQHGDHTILVLGPEIAWKDIQEAQARIHVGDERDVMILLCNYENHDFSGSFRRIHSEENPYRQLSRLEPGAVLQGTVVSVLGDDVSVAILDSARGHIPAYKIKRKPKVGERIEVVISSLLVDEGRMGLEPARDNERLPTCQVKVQTPQLVA